MAKRATSQTPDHPADSSEVAVIFPRARNPGITAFGALKPGTVYHVPAAEAARLTSEARPLHCRFDLVAPAAAVSQE